MGHPLLWFTGIGHSALLEDVGVVKVGLASEGGQFASNRSRIHGMQGDARRVVAK